MNKIYTVVFFLLITVSTAFSQTWQEWGSDWKASTWSRWNDRGGASLWQDSLYLILDNTDGNGALTNYPNLLILNANNFGSGAAKNYFSREDGTTFRFIKKTNRANVPFWVQSYSVGSSSGRIWLKFSNTSGAKDTLILFCNGVASVADSSHLETVFPAGDDFNNSSYTNLVTVDDSATGLYQVSSFASLRIAYSDTANQHNGKHAINRVSNLLYYPTDVTEPYKVLVSSIVTGQPYRSDSSQIYLWTATSKNQIPYTVSGNPVISDKSGGDPAGCTDPYLVFISGASTATDSIYCFFFYDSTGTANDGIYVAASQASDGVTWTPKTLVLQDASHRIRKPVAYYSTNNTKWYLFYSYQVSSGAPKRRTIGLAYSSEVRTTFSVQNNQFITGNYTGTGAASADSNSVEPISFYSDNSGVLWLSYEGTFANDDGNGIGGLFTTYPLSYIDLTDATFTRYTPLYETNSLISRGVFTFMDSCNAGTGQGGFVWQQSGSDSGAYRFEFITREYNPLHATNYYLFNRGGQIPQGFNGYDTVRTVYRVTDSSGIRINGATTASGHPISFINSGGVMAYNYPVTNDFEVMWEQKVADWRCNAGTLINSTFSIGDTLPCADSISTNTKYVSGDRLTYTVSGADTSIVGAMWNRTFLSGASYFNINDSAATTGSFVIGRSGFVTTADTTEAGLQYRKTMLLSPITLTDNYTVFRFRYPAIGTTKWSDSVLTVFANDIPIAYSYDAYDATQRNRSKKFLGWSFGERSNGQGGVGYMKYWAYRPIQTNYREPQTYLIKYAPTLADTSHYTVGQGTYDSSYVKDACIVYWGASNAERTYNTGGSAAANNSIGYVNSTAVEESRMLLWFSNAMLPANFILDSAVIDIYLTAGNVGGTDADGNIFMVFEVLKDWVEGNKTSYVAASMDRTMCSFTRRGSGTGVGGTTIAASDSNWFTFSANYATTVKEDFSHNWGISSSDTIKAVGTGRDNTHVTFNVTPITRKQLSTGVNYGYLIRDISAKPTGTGNYYKRPDSRESATAGQRPTITYFGRLAS